MSVSRLLPDAALPAFAYVPGRQPRPAHGHVVEHASPREQFAWGLDLFNHGYYWEAHEAWEVLWTRSRKETRRRMLLKGLILLAAAGVKVRQGKPDAMVRHAARAESIFLTLASASGAGRVLGLCPTTLAGDAEVVKSRGGASVPAIDDCSVVFPFALRPIDRT